MIWIEVVAGWIVLAVICGLCPCILSSRISRAEEEAEFRAHLGPCAAVSPESTVI